jgi:hypothetical protein
MHHNNFLKPAFVAAVAALLGADPISGQTSSSLTNEVPYAA